MTVEVHPDHLSLELQKILKDYDKQTKEAVDKAGKESVEFCNDEITKNAKAQQGSRAWAKAFKWQKRAAGDWSEYIKHFKVTTRKKDKDTNQYIWHVSGPQYRLTHLLERSHQHFLFGRPHGMTKAYPHIGPAAEKTAEHYVEKLKEAITEAGYKTEE